MSETDAQYPDGKMNDDDEGALAIRVGMDQGRIIVDFGKPVSWFGGDPDWIDSFCDQLKAKADEARRLTSR